MSTATAEKGQAPAPSAAPPQWRTLTAAAVAALALIVLAGMVAGTQLAVLAVLGLALGLVLFHSRFGFTSAWRQLVSVGQTSGIRAHLIMLGTASILFAPILAGGAALFGQQPEGNVEPIGLGLVVGAVLFGIGMQLGGACASGTLFAVGGGNTLVAVTLLFFITGATIGALHMPFWSSDQLNLGSVSLATDTGLGYAGAAILQLLVLGLLGYAATRWARRHAAPPAGRPPSARGFWRVLRGSWPLWVGAIALAALNAVVLLTRGSPWGITSAFALWGSKVLQGLGVDVASWGYWQGEKAASLSEPVLADGTSVLNFGIIIGALVAAAASGGFVLAKKLPPRVLAAAVIGGLLMGYGARLAYGCNIGAYFSGIASFSLHGWLWGALALIGTWIGLKLRPRFGLTVPKPTDGAC
ncbi:YeeE/YedE family protein [Allosaccharopolyspora coralli]|uniref:YeeE/YedE family protein n=1 Tax=Allosaccharopolyspora coralli TaxID=2665642 RepID=A0A5Q3Q4D3_9PSEU|nr:YeeE/YedE family protein [Allosaccharopolyspora coralli]QGK69468.1 YeeE/YedE family protein [Allosaccharopolyspora coralli]